MSWSLARSNRCRFLIVPYVLLSRFHRPKPPSKSRHEKCRAKHEKCETRRVVPKSQFELELLNYALKACKRGLSLKKLNENIFKKRSITVFLTRPKDDLYTTIKLFIQTPLVIQKFKQLSTVINSDSNHISIKIGNNQHLNLLIVHTIHISIFWYLEI